MLKLVCMKHNLESRLLKQECRGIKLGVDGVELMGQACMKELKIKAESLD